jgi:hypothetical protein
MLAHWAQINNKLKNKPEILTGKASCDMITDLRHKNHLNVALNNVAEVYEIAEIIKIEFDYVMTEIARSNSFILQGESVSRVYSNEIQQNDQIFFSKQNLPLKRSEASLSADTYHKRRIQNKKDLFRLCRVGLNPISTYGVEQRMTPSFYLSFNMGIEYSGTTPFHPPKVNKRIRRIVKTILNLLQNQ